MAIEIVCFCGHRFTVSRQRARKSVPCPRCQRAIPALKKDALLGRRIRELGEELYGPEGSPLLAAFLGIPQSEWRRMEAGIDIPAHLALHLVVFLRVNIDWLLDGEGPKFDAGGIY